MNRLAFLAVFAAVLLPVVLLPGADQSSSDAPVAAQADLSFDVLVYGGTSAGVMAAYTAKIQSRSVLLVERGRHLGGMSSGGLGRTDFGSREAITGLSRDFYRRIAEYYGQEGLALTFEPKAAEDIFEFYVDTADVEVMVSRQVVSVEKEGSEIESVTLEYAGEGKGGSELVVAAEEFIDTSYEGDLMARAGVSFTVGRESNDKYDETLNGVQPSWFTGSYDEMERRDVWSDEASPYVVSGDSSSELLPEIHGVGLEPTGTGDNKIQAYNFRMCLCQGEDNLPIPQPPNYDPQRYELLARRIEKDPPEDLSDLFIVSEMPEGKTDWNNWGYAGLSTDYIGGSWEYPEASYPERDSIWQEHREYQQGLVYYVTHNESVPEHIREEMQTWGYCPDEFLDTGGWPHALYIREARRMVGEYVMTENDIVGEYVDDGIALGSYPMDSHDTERVAIKGSDGTMRIKHEGGGNVGGFDPYPISYRSLTPKREEVTNLLVPVALSASHIAFGSIRMEPVFMKLGQAAGAAVVMALERNVPVQNVDVEMLREELFENPMADGTEPPSSAYRLDM